MRAFGGSIVVMVLAVGCGDEGSQSAPDATDTTRDTALAETTSAPDTTPLEDTQPEDTRPEVEPDTAVVADTLDTTEPETAPDALDTGPEEEVTSTVPLPGFGVISGDCGVLDDELTADGPSIFYNRIDFGTDPYDDADLALLTDGAKQIKADGNAGGSSIRSEMFTFEILARCELATLVKTENFVVYDDPQSKKTDMILIIDGVKIASNPTRAIAFPFDAPYTEAQAKTILEKKLGDINESTKNVSAADRWEKQILLVFAYADGHVTSIQSAWDKISAELKSDTIVFVTVTDGADTWIYSDN